MKRILFVTDARSTAFPAMSLLAGALPLERYRTTIAVVGPSPGHALRDDLAHAAPHATLTLLDGALETDEGCWDKIDELRGKLILFCERSRPDLIHTTQLSLARLPWEGPRVVTATHDLLTWTRITNRTPGVDLTRYRAEVKSGLEAASVVVAPSAFVARELERNYGLGDAARVIRHGTVPAPRAVAERGLLGIACGDMDAPEDRLDLLSAVAGRLPGKIGIVGSTPRTLPAGLVALGKPSGKDLFALMSGAKIYLGLSRYDPVGLEVAAAQAVGARLILLDTPIHRELWSGAAELVHDPESLANAIRRAAAAPRPPRPAVPRHPITTTAAAYVRLYDELLGGAEEPGLAA